MSRALHLDLGRAHVHRATPEALAEAGAAALTVGSHAVFGPRPTLAEAAHEAVHLVQATTTSPQARSITDAQDAPEREADRLARVISAGGSVDPSHIEQRLPPGTAARVPPRVDTPAWPPLPAPGDSPPEEQRYDAEGNAVAAVGDRWYLVGDAPVSVAFPIASGFKPQLLPPNPNASFASLHDDVEAIRDEQLATANSLRGDPKYWFAKVYYFVTRFELEAIDAGTYQYPHMKMQEVQLFHATYARNLEAWRSGDLASVEANWRAAFQAAEDSDSGVQQFMSASVEIKNALLPSMEAHIRFDLPRALAAAYNIHYSGIPGGSLEDFRPDFFGMAPVFEQANEALQPEIDEEGTDWNPSNWGWMGDVAFPFFFSVGLERDMAWEKARMIQSATGLSPDALESRMHSTMTVMHPNLEPFDVDGDTVTGYDFTDQPGLVPDTQPGPVNGPPVPPPTDLPDRLYFRLNLPEADEDLADAVRPDQDLRPLLALAEWTRQVRGAVILLEGHASSEGPEVLNANLADARGFAVKYFLYRASADLDNNAVVLTPTGEAGSSPTPEYRYVAIRVLIRGLSKQQVWTPASNVPANPPR